MRRALVLSRLGQRFKAVILIPASLVVFIGATLAMHASTGIWVSLFIGFSSWCAIQMGYFVGLGVNVILAGGTAAPGRDATLHYPVADKRVAP